MSRTQLLETATAYIEAHNKHSPEAVIALCAPSCTHRGGPSSLKTPDRNNKEYKDFNIEVFKDLHEYHITISDTIIDEVAKKVVIIGQTKGAANVGTFDNEYILVLEMSEDAKKVVAQYDFVDSAGIVEWMGRLGEWAKQKWESKEQ